MGIWGMMAAPRRKVSASWAEAGGYGLFTRNLELSSQMPWMGSLYQRYNATTALTMYSDSFPSPKSVLVPWARSDTPKETSPCWREGSHQLSWGVTRWHTKNKHKNPHLVVFLMTPQMYRNIKMVKRARDLRRDAEKQLYPESKLITY